MNVNRDQERHYRVVRYYPHFGHGLISQELGVDLTLDEAEKLRQEHAGKVEGEEVVIEDQNLSGIEKEIIAEPDEEEAGH